jgi:hypothetical protein
MIVSYSLSFSLFLLLTCTKRCHHINIWISFLILFRKFFFFFFFFVWLFDILLVFFQLLSFLFFIDHLFLFDFNDLLNELWGLFLYLFILDLFELLLPFFELLLFLFLSLVEHLKTHSTLFSHHLLIGFSRHSVIPQIFILSYEILMIFLFLVCFWEF